MRRSGPFICCGIALVGAAALLSNAAIEHALLGTATGALRWGPTLLRLLLAAQGVALMIAAAVVRQTPLNAPLPVAAPRDDARAWALVAVLTAIALALRLWQLNSGLWFDEVLTLTDFVRPPIGRILTTFPNQNQHMLFSLLAHASVALFGESVWALRLPAAVFGAASVAALFLLGRRVLDTREALLACALLTVSYHHVWFSQNARGYSGLMFFATLATWLWLEALRRNAWRWWIGYAVAVALGAWIHLTMVFVPAAHAVLYGAYVVLRRPIASREVRQPLVAWLLAASLILEFHALALPQFLSSALHEVSLPSEWTNPLWVVLESWRSLGIAFGKGAAVLLALFLAASGWVSITRRDWMAGGCLVLPAVLGGGAMLASGHNLWPRFFFFSIGFALLIAIHGAMVAPRVLAERVSLQMSAVGVERVSLVLAMTMIFASALSLPRGYALPKQDFVGARDYVEHARDADDAVVAVGLAGVAFRRYFAPQWSVAQTGAELDAVRQAHRRVWLVYTLPIELKAYRGDLWNMVQHDFQVVRVFPGTLGGGEVTVCRERSNRDGRDPG